MGPSLMSLLWLALVLLSIPAVLWLLRRSGWGGLGGAVSHGSPMRVLSQTPLGPQQRLVLVEIGEGASRCRLLLGVTAQQVSVLHQMPADEPGPAPAGVAAPAAEVSFRRLFEGWRLGRQPVRESGHAG
ncbi:MAG: flagellar biosynthetic protein FliO [Pseudomonadota bacterium]|jgi:flagellar protein FliO/FliZ